MEGIDTKALFTHPDVQELIARKGVSALDSFDGIWKDDNDQIIICYPDEDLWMYHSPQTSWQRVYASNDRDHSKDVLEKKYGYRYLCTELAYGYYWDFYIDPK